MSILTFSDIAPPLTRFQDMFTSEFWGPDYFTEEGVQYAQHISGGTASGFRVQSLFTGTGAGPNFSIQTLNAREYVSYQTAFSFAAVGGAYAVADFAAFLGNGRTSAAFMLSRADTISGAPTVASYLEGFGGADVLIGGSGDDILDGGTGADDLRGGGGSDTATYISAAAGLIVSLANPTINTGEAAGDVFTSVENLRGSSYNDSLNGSSVANTINGAAGDDTIKGYAGNDVLEGSTGNDVLIGGLGGDTLSGGSGSDTASYAGAASGVIASLANSSINTGEAAGDTYISIERLIGTSFNDSLNGANVVNNTLRGGGGNDTLKGYTGNDVLEGGAGQDIFVFNTVLNASTNVDRILDFSAADDTIHLAQSIFAGIAAKGALLSGYFKNLDTGSLDANDRILYRPSTGILYYDQDGTGAAGAVRFAELVPGTAMNHLDFFVI